MCPGSSGWLVVLFTGWRFNEVHGSSAAHRLLSSKRGSLTHSSNPPHFSILLTTFNFTSFCQLVIFYATAARVTMLKTMELWLSANVLWLEIWDIYSLHGICSEGSPNSSKLLHWVQCIQFISGDLFEITVRVLMKGWNVVDGAESFKHPEVGKELWVTQCFFYCRSEPERCARDLFNLCRRCVITSVVPSPRQLWGQERGLTTLSE